MNRTLAGCAQARAHPVAPLNAVPYPLHGLVLPWYPPNLPVRSPTGCEGAGPSFLNSDPRMSVIVPGVTELSSRSTTFGSWAATVSAAGRSERPLYSTTDLV